MSVVLPVRDGVPLVRAAIEGVLGQTFRDLELVVVDDGSTDATAEVAAGYRDPRVVVVRNERNLGLTRSLNVGLARARGELVARQDADDRSGATRIEKQVAHLDAHPRVALCATWARLVDESGRLLPAARRPPGPPRLRSLLLRLNPLVHGTILFRAEAVRAVGGYREQFRLTQDYDLYLRLLDRHELDVVPEALYEFRFTAGGLSSAGLLEQAAFAELARRLRRERLERGRDALDDGAPIEPLLAAARGAVDRAAVQRQLGRYHLTVGDGAGARRALRRAMRLRPLDPRAYALFAASLVRT